MIQEAGFQIGETSSKIGKALLKSNETEEQARDKPGIILDADTAQFLYLMKQQTNPLLKLGVNKKLDPGEIEWCLSILPR